jgi:phage terminase small subunit
MAILEPLSYKQQKFCEEYLLNFNAYRAAISAGYTENTARKGDLLHVPKIQAYLKDAMSRSAARAELTHDMLLRELIKIAFCSMGDYYDDQGDPKRMHELTDDEKAAISYFERKDVEGEEGYIKGEVFKIKLHNKMAAIDKLCRHTGFYKAKWQPKVVIQPVETEEDIAFEAESAKTTAQPYTEEVVKELLEQAGLGDVGSLMSEVGEEEEEGGSREWQGLEPGVLSSKSVVLSQKSGNCGEALQRQDQVKHSLQMSASTENSNQQTVGEDTGSGIESSNQQTVGEDTDSGIEDTDSEIDMGRHQNILTLSPPRKNGRWEK